VISAHWEAARPTLTSGDKPPLIYDYYGFPPESYEISYPAPGAPALAARIAGMFRDGALKPVLDAQRGFDHGLFVPLKVMYPRADIPCLQLSLLTGLDAKSHIQLGQALSELKKENILVIGSGFSFHNMRAFFTSHGDGEDRENEAFQHWLSETCTDSGLPEEERERRLANWEQAPFARYCHPREEHLLPLHVCYGMAGAAGRLVFNGRVLGKTACAILWNRG